MAARPQPHRFKGSVPTCGDDARPDPLRFLVGSSAESLTDVGNFPRFPPSYFTFTFPAGIG